MTLATLLEELKEVDAEQSEKLQCWIGRTRQAMNLEMPLECDLAQALIQASIQRACERRGWYLRQVQSIRAGKLACDVWIDKSDLENEIYITPCDGYGDSPAEALLAAYIAAVRAEAK